MGIIGELVDYYRYVGRDLTLQVILSEPFLSDSRVFEKVIDHEEKMRFPAPFQPFKKEKPRGLS